MNPFVIAGAVVLVGVLVGYAIITRREIAQLPPLEAKPPNKKARQDQKRATTSTDQGSSRSGGADVSSGQVNVGGDVVGRDINEGMTGAVAEGERPKTEPPKIG